MRILSRFAAAVRPMATAAAILALLGLALAGCGGASNDSGGGRSTLWNTGSGGNLQVTVSNPATRSARGAATATTVRVHVQSNGTDVTSYQQATIPATGSSVTLDFGWVSNSANAILVELLDATGNVLSTQTSAVAWTSSTGSLLVQVSLGSGSATVAGLRQYVYVATTGANRAGTRFVDDPTLQGIDLFSVDATGTIVGSAVPQATGGEVTGLAVTPDQKFVVAIVGSVSPSLQAFAIDASTGTLTRVTQTASTSVAGANGGIAVNATGTAGAVGIAGALPVGNLVRTFTLSGTGQIALVAQYATGDTPRQLSTAHVDEDIILAVVNSNLIWSIPFSTSGTILPGIGGVGTSPITNITRACATLPNGVGLLGTNRPDGNCSPYAVTHITVPSNAWMCSFDGLNPLVVGNGTQVANSAAIANVTGYANPVGVLTTNLGTGGTKNLFAGTVVGGYTGSFTPLTGTNSLNIAGVSASTFVVPATAAQASPTNAVSFLAVVGTGGLTPVSINVSTGLTAGTTVPLSAAAQDTCANTVGYASFYP